MEILLIILGLYLAAGLGFSLASWLQSAEQEVEAGKKHSPFFSKTFLLFMAIWPLIALYCYRAEVKKSISEIDWDKLKDEK